jgi:5'-nucleotidase/UDP-sugar diphosphatase
MRSCKIIITWAILASFITLAAITLSLANDEHGQCLTLTILHTNDRHGHLFPFDYEKLGTHERQVGGAARMATLIRRIKEECHHPVLVFDTGDIFSRGPLADLEGKVDFEVMNAIGFDAVAVGNNEFVGAHGTRGLAIFRERLAQARFPLLSANIYDAATGKHLVPPYTVLEVGNTRIGVLSVTTPRIAYYPQTRGLRIQDPVEAVREILPELEGKCDFVIALTHLGLAADLELARALPRLSLIVGGDSHTWLFRPMRVVTESGSVTWIAQAGEWGSKLGRIDVTLCRNTLGRLAIQSCQGELVPIERKIEPASDVQAIIDRAARPFTRKVGKLAKAISLREAPAWTAERLRKATRADIAVVPIAAIESGLPAGKITELDVRKMAPIKNKLVALYVTGDQLTKLIGSGTYALSGAKFKDGIVFIGDKPANANKRYLMVVEDYYARNAPALKNVVFNSLGITTCDLVIRSFR